MTPARLLLLAALLGLSGCRATAGVPPAVAPPEPAALDALRRLRTTFEQEDHAALMSQVDPYFQPDRDRLEQGLIDAFARVREIRFDFQPGAGVPGLTTTGLAAHWVRVWTVEGVGQEEKREGDSTFVFDRGSGRLLRIEGQEPFGP